MSFRTIHIPLTLGLLFAGSAHAAPLHVFSFGETEAPASGSSSAATPAAVETSAQPTEAASPVATAKPRAKASPKAAASPVATAATVVTPDAEEEEAARREKEIAGDVKDEIAYRTSRAKRRFDKGPIAESQKAEITRAMERALSQIDTQAKRVDDALAEKGAGSLDHVTRLEEEVSALSKVAHTAAEQVEAVRTHDDGTEATLQGTSEEIDKIADRAEELAEKLSNQKDAMEERVDAATEKAHDVVSGVGILKGKDGKVHIGMQSKDDRVEYGAPVEVKKGEKVQNAVALGGSVTIAGEVMEDVVAVGGPIHVTESGHIHGDAVAIGGHVQVDEGGKVDGEKTAVGAGKIAGNFIQSAVAPHAEEPEHEASLVGRMGSRLFWGAAHFLFFFLGGMFVLLVAPRRVLVVADGLEARPLASGLIGAILWVAVVPISFILLITIIGAPLFLIGVTLAAFFGYVALALLIGRRLPTGVKPTSNAHFAIGAAIVAAVGMLPYGIGWLAWITLAVFALGAVAITRFGAEPGSPNVPNASDAPPTAAVA